MEESSFNKHSLNIDKAEKDPRDSDCAVASFLSPIFCSPPLSLPLSLSQRFTTNQCVISHWWWALPLAFIFHLCSICKWKIFTSNVSRQAFRAQSVPLYIPIFSKTPQQRDIHWGGRACYYTSHQTTMCRRPRLKTAWVEEQVGGPQESQLLINLVALVGALNKDERLEACTGLWMQRQEASWTWHFQG